MVIVVFNCLKINVTRFSCIGNNCLKISRNAFSRIAYIYPAFTLTKSDEVRFLTSLSYWYSTMSEFPLSVGNFFRWAYMPNG